MISYIKKVSQMIVRVVVISSSSVVVVVVVVVAVVVVTFSDVLFLQDNWLRLLYMFNLSF